MATFDLNAAEVRIWNKLKTFWLSDYAVAAIMGQIFAESGLRSNNLQNSANKSLGMTDEEYVAGVDNGTYTNFVRDSKGFGFCQWTFWSRKEALLNYARKTNRSIADEEMQLEYLWSELQQCKTVKNALLTSTSVRFISDTLLHDFEQPADQSAKVEALRAAYAQLYYDKYAGRQVQPTKKNYMVGWNKDETGWWYADTSETYLSNCWKDINGHRYHFNNDGYISIGWDQVDGEWFYFEHRSDVKDSPQGALYETKIVKV